MKTPEEIKEQIESLKRIKDHSDSKGSDISEIDFKIVALEWVLGYQSDIFN